jgi:putative ABC transport system permease protein
VVRHDGDAAAAVAGVRAVLKRLDPGLPIADVRTMEELVSASVAGPRTTALLLSIFAGAALLLAAVGLYGVVAYAVSLRTRELGIRMALGAAAADVRRLVLGQGAVLAGLGVAIGLAGALAASRVLQGLLYGVSATDPAVFAALSILLAAVALGATWLPAFRASRLDPTAALREE